MKLATAPVNWNNADTANYREWTAYPQLLEEMKRAGYSATEWGMNMEKEPAKMVADLNQRGLQMLGGFVGLNLRTDEAQKSEIERGIEIGRFFKSIGGNYLIAADSGDERRRQEAGHVDSMNGLKDEQWKNFGSGLNEIASALKKEEVNVVFHNHVGTYVETEDETARLLDETDSALVHWCLDCGHLAYGGGDSLRMIERYGHRIGYVHIKDVDGIVLEKSRKEGWSFQQALKNFIFAPLGQGVAQVPEVIAALKTQNYNGWIVIEQDTTPDDPTENAKNNRLYLEKVLSSELRVPSSE
jgi:inosose dehydratase